MSRDFYDFCGQYPRCDSDCPLYESTQSCIATFEAIKDYLEEED